MNTLLLHADRQQDLAAAAQIIKNGGLVGLPTETVYGLGANGLDVDAVAKIFVAKGRPSDNPLILHLAEASEIDRYCIHIPDCARTLIEKFWPGPLTIVLKASGIVPKRTTGGLDTVAVRCPANAVTRQIIRLAGVPIAAPSANLSGKPSTTTAQHVLHDMNGRIDAVVDGGPSSVGLESTIVDLSGDCPRLLRPGGITPEQLVAALGELTVDEAVTSPLGSGAIARAPGMKYKHYAPACDVLIVEGSRLGAADYIRQHFTKGNAVLCFEEELPLYADFNATAYGKESDPATLSAGLFAALRQLDDASIGTIFARCPEGGGLAFAIQNRLHKSAGFHIVNGDTDK